MEPTPDPVSSAASDPAAASSVPPAPASPYEPSSEQRLDLSGFASAVDRLRTQVRQVIVGQEAVLDELLAALFAGGHVLLEGVPGVAKTLMARLLARALSVPFQRIQFTPDLMPSDVLGTSVFNPQTAEFTFHQGPIFASLILIDEINRAPAKTQAALFEVMEEHQVTVDGTTYPMQEPFLVLATQNPVEHEGTYRLPEAQLDRFLFKVEVGYPTLSQETDILRRAHTHGGHLDPAMIRSVLTAEQVLQARRVVQRLYVDDRLLHYIAQIVDGTRKHPAVALAASPRASLALLNAAKAFAAMAGRDFVTPDDIRLATEPVLRHRLTLTPEREIEGIRVETVVRRIVEGIEVPR